MNNLLFVCRENRFRSVLAAQFFAKLMSEKKLTGISVGSAGTWAKNGLEPMPEVKRIAERYGLDLSRVRSRIVNQKLLEQSSLIVAMTQSQAEALAIEFPRLKPRITLLSRICEGMEYDIPDPYEDSEETVENTAEEIFNLISTGFDNIYDQVKKTVD